MHTQWLLLTFHIMQKSSRVVCWGKCSLSYQGHFQASLPPTTHFLAYPFSHTFLSWSGWSAGLSSVRSTTPTTRAVEAMLTVADGEVASAGIEGMITCMEEGFQEEDENKKGWKQQGKWMVIYAQDLCVRGNLWKWYNSNYEVSKLEWKWNEQQGYYKTLTFPPSQYMCSLILRWLAALAGASDQWIQPPYSYWLRMENIGKSGAATMQALSSQDAVCGHFLCVRGKR